MRPKSENHSRKRLSHQQVPGVYHPRRNHKINSSPVRTTTMIYGGKEASVASEAEAQPPWKHRFIHKHLKCSRLSALRQLHLSVSSAWRASALQARSLFLSLWTSAAASGPLTWNHQLSTPPFIRFPLLLPQLFFSFFQLDLFLHLEGRKRSGFVWFWAPRHKRILEKFSSK